MKQKGKRLCPSKNEWDPTKALGDSTTRSQQRRCA